MAVRVQKTLWPLDRDPNKPMDGFNEWQKYLKMELSKTKVFHINPLLEGQIADARGKVNTLLMAKRILRYGRN
ncbi:hypothetical protein [Sphingobacterium faecium]|uniref:hypothetical protein n=1 Tax=Sphingobacterium faecium TaxID=34087 RepID=UPI002478FD84|nr:hypothetical protein [Sphingobacterium faecium]WGQ15617.1 hypothetical protein QG727_04225 [Sphingobacterium faecium]